MGERRRAIRRKVYLGGRVAFNHRRSTVDGLIRNMGEGGARLVLPHPVLLPAEFDLAVAVMDRSFRARIAWQGSCELGLAFLDCEPSANVVPLDLAIRIRGMEGDRRRLQRRIDQLSR